jgi:MOSC domain-containing protein YiiM
VCAFAKDSIDLSPLNSKLNSSALSGRVASLHVHAIKPGEPLRSVESVYAVAEKGLAEDTRYFDRRNRFSGSPEKRQVALIEREQIAEHAATLGLQTIPPGAVRANIETMGINLHSLMGQEVEVGEAILLVYKPRDPCGKMDLICAGLRQLMENARQGVLAQVVQSGTIRVGDTIRPRRKAS